MYSDVSFSFNDHQATDQRRRTFLRAMVDKSFGIASLDVVDYSSFRKGDLAVPHEPENRIYCDVVEVHSGDCRILCNRHGSVRSGRPESQFSQLVSHLTNNVIIFVGPSSNQSNFDLVYESKNCFVVATGGCP